MPTVAHRGAGARGLVDEPSRETHAEIVDQGRVPCRSRAREVLRISARLACGSPQQANLIHKGPDAIGITAVWDISSHQTAGFAGRVKGLPSAQGVV